MGSVKLQRCVLLLQVGLVFGFDSSLLKTGGSLPFLEEISPREPKRTPGCWLGNDYYELEQTWSPSLEPHGTRNCVKCQCLPVIRKGVLQHIGRVKCRNIKRKCPKPTCDNPVMLPNRCCKTCPGDTESFEDTFTMVPKVDEGVQLISDGEKQTNEPTEFVALLVGDQVPRSGPIRTRGVAKVYLKLTDTSTIQYTVQYTGIKRPKFIRLTDENGSVLREIRVGKQRRRARKVCGVWNKVPSLYFQLMRSGRLYVVMTSKRHPEGEIAGNLGKFQTSTDVTFESLLMSPKSDGIGGSAELFYDVNKKTLSYRIMFEGLFSRGRSNREYFVTIEKNTKIVHEDTNRASDTAGPISGVWQHVSVRNSKMLSRRRLRLRVTSKGGTTITGYVQLKITCEKFYTVLANDKPSASKPTGAGGSAVLQLLPDGSVEFKVGLAGLTSPVVGLTIENAPNKHGRRTKVFSMLGSYATPVGLYDGSATGRFKKHKAVDVANLLAGQLFVNVATRDNPVSELRGRISSTQFNDNIDISGESGITILPEPEAATGGAAQAWFSTDKNCVLHYFIAVAGLAKKGETVRAFLAGEMEDWHRNSNDAVQMVMVSNFINDAARGSISDIPVDTFSSLNKGTAVLIIETKSDDQRSLRSNITVSNTCWEMSRDHDMELLMAMQQENRLEKVDKFRCEYEGIYYADGESWLPVDGVTCNTCSCQRGKIRCHAVVCPALSCANPIKLEGECCATCPDPTFATIEETGLLASNTTCYFHGDKRWHPAGTTWHPYVPPFGYIKCAICRCMPGSGEVNCTRKTCPKLDCPLSEAIRLNEDDCCQVCPKKPPTPAPEMQPLADKNMEGACTFGDQVYENNTWWHPEVKPFGSMKCFICKCQDGVHKCEKQQCPKLNCSKKNQIVKNGSCCPVCKGRRKTSRRRKQTGSF